MAAGEVHRFMDDGCEVKIERKGITKARKSEGPKMPVCPEDCLGCATAATCQGHGSYPPNLVHAKAPSRKAAEEADGIERISVVTKVPGVTIVILLRQNRDGGPWILGWSIGGVVSARRKLGEPPWPWSDRNAGLAAAATEILAAVCKPRPGNPIGGTALQIICAAVRKFRARYEAKAAGGKTAAVRPAVSADARSSNGRAASVQSPARNGKAADDGHRGEIRNPKPEIRNKSEIQNPKSKIAGTALVPAAPADLPLGDGPALSAAERKDLARLETLIDRGVRASFAAGIALKEIQERKLYREHFATFEDYCRQKLGSSRSDAYRQIQAATLHEVAETVIEKNALVVTESHFRPLSKLDDDQVRAVFAAVAKRVKPGADGRRHPTMELVAETAREYATPPEEKHEARNPKSETNPKSEIQNPKSADLSGPANSDGDKGRAGGQDKELGGRREEEEKTTAPPGFEIEGLRDRPQDIGDVNWWNGQPCVYAAVLHNLRHEIRRVAYTKLRGSEIGDFRRDLAAMLNSMADAIAAAAIGVSAGSGRADDSDAEGKGT
ncbi:MAG: hypothetical protein ABSA30_00150 [Candidatus Aminicenantales bacterium]